ncbi:testis expressed protein 56-like [Erethizon dorsatum]
MDTTTNYPLIMKCPAVGQKRELKNYASPDVLCHTFETLSNLHKLLPNHMMEMLYSYKSDEDKKKSERAELSGLERILERHRFPPEINLTPKPSRIPSWKRKAASNVSEEWKKCSLWNRNSEEPPMCTIVASLPSTPRVLGAGTPARLGHSVPSGRSSLCVLSSGHSEFVPSTCSFARWLKKNTQPAENLKLVMDQLAGFGPIRSVTACGRQSAIVVFWDVDAACKAMNAFHSRIPGTDLQCSWRQRFMSENVRFSVTSNPGAFF